MIEIKDLLAKFSNLLLGEEGKKDTVRNVINEVTGLSITTEQIQIKKGTVYLDIKPIYKSEIFLKKEKIFSRLEELFSTKSPSDIR